MLSPDLVIFDCDGVLIDSEPLASRTLAEALQKAGIAISPAEAHRVFTGKAEPDIRQLCVEQYGLTNVEAVFSDWHAHLLDVFARELTPMAGMLDLVSILPGAKCVASNSRLARLQGSLGLTALWQHFAPHVYSAEMVARPKPAPDLLLHCAMAFSARPSRCLMIDDSAHGITAARQAGMIAIGFVDPTDPRPNRIDTLHDAGADAVVTGAAELFNLLSTHPLDMSTMRAAGAAELPSNSDALAELMIGQ